MSQSIEDRIAAAAEGPRTIDVEVCRSSGLVNLHGKLVDELAAAVDAAQAGRSIADEADPRIIELGDEIVAVEQAMAEHTTIYELRSVGALGWNNLLREHPPRPGLDKGLAYNLVTFPAAAVAACCDDLTIDEAQAMYGTTKEAGSLHSAEWNKLFHAAYIANEVETPHPKLPAAIGDLLASVRSSISAAPEG